MDILLKFYTWMYYYTCRYRCVIAEAYGDILLYILYYYTIYYYIYITIEGHMGKFQASWR